MSMDDLYFNQHIALNYATLGGAYNIYLHTGADNKSRLSEPMPEK